MLINILETLCDFLLFSIIYLKCNFGIFHFLEDWIPPKSGPIFLINRLGIFHVFMTLGAKLMRYIPILRLSILNHMISILNHMICQPRKICFSANISHHIKLHKLNWVVFIHLLHNSPCDNAILPHNYNLPSFCCLVSYLYRWLRNNNSSIFFHFLPFRTMIKISRKQT